MMSVILEILKLCFTKESFQFDFSPAKDWRQVSLVSTILDQVREHVPTWISIIILQIPLNFL